MVGTINALDILLQNVNTPVIAIDHHEHILFCNQAAAHLFGLGNAPIIGQALRRIIKNPDILALLTEGEGQNTRREINFTERNQVYSAERVELQGVGSLVMMQDITNLKELSRLRNEFVGTITRDVRSPLTAIIGYIELLERMGPLNDQQRNFIGRIIFSVHSITALLNNLQELEKVGAVLETDRKTVQMQMIVLLDNAIKYTPAGGRIVVELTPESDFVLLIVADTGIGVLPEDQPYIFSKFYRASNVVGDTVGTGLGLSIVQSIVEQHGGRIWVDSQVNQGTTFTVMLPCYGDTADLSKGH